MPQGVRHPDNRNAHGRYNGEAAKAIPVNGIG
jgi:hypothetical protein